MAHGTRRGELTTPAFRSLLYREPRLYDLVFPDIDQSVGKMVLTAIDRWLPAMPRSILDLGCGTGRLLEHLGQLVPDCCGVDLLESNIAYARSVRCGISFQVGDMRTLRLDRTFDLVVCLGNALSYALTDDALMATVRTFGAHAHAGTLLIVDPLNAWTYLGGRGFERRIEGRVDTPGFRATSVSVHEIDREARVLRRVRTWRIAGQPDVADYAEYRLLFPAEIRRFLETADFDVLDMYDNRQFQSTDLTGTVTAEPDVGGMRGRKLYVFATKR
jgi:SAM-dependent methyltransferase